MPPDRTPRKPLKNAVTGPAGKGPGAKQNNVRPTGKKPNASGYGRGDRKRPPNE